MYENPQPQNYIQLQVYLMIRVLLFQQLPVFPHKQRVGHLSLVPLRRSSLCLQHKMDVRGSYESPRR